ncbi:MAG: NCS1 family nucleobase:cation symporter-1 [Flavobacteriales bacterium]|nr:NCS1 family nucleobase:cation symporter-1 [Flavobacteriales bacterium]
MSGEIVELREDISDSPLYSEDLAPVPKDKRTWSMMNLAAIWVGMAVCIPTYILASYMIRAGLSWYAALSIIAFANLIITVPMVLNGHAGVKYGIPFPVLGRAAFGHKGIHVASILRAIVACGWFGIQTWIGGMAFYAIWNAVMGVEGSAGLDFGKFVGFAVFWVVNVFFIWKGTESIKWLEDFSAPILVLIGLLLIGWGFNTGGGLSVVLDQSKQLEKPAAILSYEQNIDKLVLSLNPVQDKDGTIKATHYQLTIPTTEREEEERWTPITNDWVPILVGELSSKIDKAAIIDGTKKLKVQFRDDGAGDYDFIYSSIVSVPLTSTEGKGGFASSIWLYLIWLTAMVGFWATMAISIADITRFASSQKDQVKGQFIGLPGTMIFYSFVGVFVTCAAVIGFKDVLISDDAPWDPVTLLGKFESVPLVIVSQIFMIIATLSTNIAANVIAPSNAFSNLLPQKLSFRGGGMVTAIIGILICPWWILGSIEEYLILFSGLLGPVLAIFICDYFVLRKKELVLADLYKEDGVYSYGNGYNSAAIVAFIVGGALAIIGRWVPAFELFYNLSWFTGFIVAFVIYYLMMKKNFSPQ